MSAPNLGLLLRHALLLGAAGALLVSSCILDREGGMQVGGGGAGTGGGTGAEGGDVQCNTIADCPDPGNDCEEKSCIGGWCGIHPVVQGETCYVGGEAWVCDGQGNCVKVKGDDCLSGDECLSGHCTDDVCCDAGCDRECETCGTEAAELGTCEPYVAGTDPELECGTGTCDGASECANGEHIFSDEYGDSGEQWPRVIAVGPSDEIVIGGYFDGNLNWGGNTLVPTNIDAYVVKLDATGAYIWDHHYGASGYEYVRGVAVDELGNVIVCGHYSSTLDLDDGNGEVSTQGSYDMFVVKLDPSGNHQWSHRFGDSDTQYCRGLAVDDQNNVILIGEIYGTVDFGTGQPVTTQGGGDVVVAKIDAAGTVQWANGYGDMWEQAPWDIAVDSSNRIIVVGDFAGNLDFGGGSLVAGSTIYRDVFVAKLDPGGGHVFSKDFGDSTYEDFGNAVAVDGDNNVIVVGSFEDDIDFGGGIRTAVGWEDGFVVQLDGSGNYQWDHTFGDGGWLSLYGVATDNHQNVIVGGEFDSSANFGGDTLTAAGQDVFLAKYTYEGIHLWSAHYGDGSTQWLEELATNSQRHIIVAGHFNGTMNFGGANLASSGTDLYLAILEP